MAVINTFRANNCRLNNVSWYRIVLVITFFLLVSFSFLSERVPMNNGAGWDGVIYRDMGSNFLTSLNQGLISEYYIQKCLPFAIVNVVDTIINNDNHFVTLVILIYITLAIAIWGFFKIVNHIKLSKNAEIIAFSLFFFIYPTIKLTGYYPWLGDVFAYTIGIWVYYFFLTKQKIKMLAVSIIGAFTWQSILKFSILLCILPNEPFQITKGINVSQKERAISDVIKVICSFAVLGSTIILFLYAKSKGGWYKYLECIPFCFQNIPYWAVGLSTVCMCVLTCLILKPLSFNIIYAFWAFFNKIRIVDILIAIAVFMIVKIVIMNGANPNLQSPVNGRFGFYRRLLWEPMTVPLKFMEMHLLYYGLLLPFLILFYKKYLEIISDHSMSYIVAFALILFFGTQTESRFVINLIPFVIVPIAQVLSGLKLKKWVVYAIVAFQLYISHFWFHINVDGVAEDMQSWDVVGYLTNKAQRYFFMHGPWQGLKAYYIYISLFFIVLMFMYVGKKKNWFVYVDKDKMIK